MSAVTSTTAGLFFLREDLSPDPPDESERGEKKPFPGFADRLAGPVLLSDHHAEAVEDEGQDDEGNEQIPELAKDDVHVDLL